MPIFKIVPSSAACIAPISSRVNKLFVEFAGLGEGIEANCKNGEEGNEGGIGNCGDPDKCFYGKERADA